MSTDCVLGSGKGQRLMVASLFAATTLASGNPAAVARPSKPGVEAVMPAGAVTAIGTGAPARPKWPWWLVAVGAGIAAAGGVTWHMGERDFGTVRDAIDRGARSGGIDMTLAQAKSLRGSGRSMTIGGTTLVALGGAAAVTGAILLIVWRPKEPTYDIYPAWNGSSIGPVARGSGVVVTTAVRF